MQAVKRMLFALGALGLKLEGGQLEGVKGWAEMGQMEWLSKGKAHVRSQEWGWWRP